MSENTVRKPLISDRIGRLILLIGVAGFLASASFGAFELTQPARLIHLNVYVQSYRADYCPPAEGDRSHEEPCYRLLALGDTTEYRLYGPQSTWPTDLKQDQQVRLWVNAGSHEVIAMDENPAAWTPTYALGEFANPGPVNMANPGLFDAAWRLGILFFLLAIVGWGLSRPSSKASRGPTP
jgi:hypothetical protein